MLFLITLVEKIFKLMYTQCREKRIWLVPNFLIFCTSFKSLNKCLIKKKQNAFLNEDLIYSSKKVLQTFPSPVWISEKTGMSPFFKVFRLGCECFQLWLYTLTNKSKGILVQSLFLRDVHYLHSIAVSSETYKTQAERKRKKS